MDTKPFTFDFGTLPEEYLNETPVSNVMRLWWNDEMKRVLRLCGASELVIGNASSDYDKLFALCSVMPLLAGHPIKSYCEDTLSIWFGIETPILPEKCKEIWENTAESLLLHPMSVLQATRLLSSEDGLSWLCPQTELPERLPKDIKPVFFGNALLASTTKSDDWTAFRTYADDVLNRYAANGCDSAFLRIPQEFLFCEPNPYNVSRCLRGERLEDAEFVWTGQLLRLLCEECQRRDWTLILEIGSSATEFLPLLRFVERSVGLPQLVWMSKDMAVWDEMLEFSSHPRPKEILWTLCLKDYPCTAEWSCAVERAAARYPQGRLLAHTGTDMRYGMWLRRRIYQ